jgi:hypothetical protein
VTIKYALTRTEIVRSYSHSLTTSRKFLAMIVIYSVALGLLPLLVNGAFSRGVETHDAIVAFAWMLTQIGSMKGEIPWSKVKLVADGDEHVLIVGATGNAFFIPAEHFRERSRKRSSLNRSSLGEAAKTSFVRAASGQ